jgi:hypothetical protein
MFQALSLKEASEPGNEMPPSRNAGSSSDPLPVEPGRAAPVEVQLASSSSDSEPEPENLAQAASEDDEDDSDFLDSEVSDTELSAVIDGIVGPSFGDSPAARATA